MFVVGTGRERVGKHSVNRPKKQTYSDLVRKYQLQTTTSHAPKTSLGRNFTRKDRIQTGLLFANLFVVCELELKTLQTVD
jgi:hypothetical protein